MPVRLVTDSVADLPPQIVKELGITVVPLNVRFGEEIFRDDIDLTTEQFYERLACGKTIITVFSLSAKVVLTGRQNLAVKR